MHTFSSSQILHLEVLLSTAKPFSPLPQEVVNKFLCPHPYHLLCNTLNWCEACLVLKDHTAYATLAFDEVGDGRIGKSRVIKSDQVSPGRDQRPHLSRRVSQGSFAFSFHHQTGP